MLIFDHLNLDNCSRKLIALACKDATTIKLAPIDKGLSGASVWLAQWEMPNGFQTKFHVFKIGDKKKLSREYEGITNIAAVIERGFPHFAFYLDESLDIALLRQEFMGEDDGTSNNLKNFIHECNDPRSVINVIQNLYSQRMAEWHSPSINNKKKMVRLSEALDWWVIRADLKSAANKIGFQALDNILAKKFGLSINLIERKIQAICQETIPIQIGPVHGDLHAQNVLIDSKGNLQLIDFGWTGLKWRAVDFLMMECSLKFLVSPPHARIEDLILLEKTLEQCWDCEIENINWSNLDNSIHGKDLIKIASAIGAVRRCAKELGAIQSNKQYRLGLILLTAGLTSMPKLINRVFMFHSLSYHLYTLS
jgi:hypothetical protein